MQSPHSLKNLIACPQCDALYDTSQAQKLVCQRCHTRLVDPRRAAGLKVLALALLSAGLVYGVVTQPFLTVKRFWMTTDATLLETALAFEGPLLLLSVLVLAMVLILPALRLGLVLYVLCPLVVGKSKLPGARMAYLWSEKLRPWSMAEIFALGCGVALFKIIDMAEVSFGLAFWMFGALVVLLWVQDNLTCRYSVWDALDDE